MPKPGSAHATPNFFGKPPRRALTRDRECSLFCHMSDADSKLLKGSRLYREFLAEREEIMRHKWFESEKAGHDVGFEKALLDWLVRHRATWRQKRQDQQRQQHAATA